MITDFIYYIFSILGSVLFTVLGYAFNVFLRLLPFIILLVAFIVVKVLIAKKFAKTAKMKGHKKVHAFAMCFWLGLPGYIYVTCLPDLKTEQLKTLASKILELGEESIPDESTIKH